MKNIKRKRRRRPPSQLLGPTRATNYRPSPSHLLSAGPRARSSRLAPTRAQQPSLRPSYARTPSARLRSLPLGPARQPRAVHPHAPLPFAAVAASGPCPSAIPCSSSPRRAQPSADQRPIASAEWAKGSRPSHGLAPPWRSAHANAMPTTHAPQAARCARRDP